MIQKPNLKRVRIKKALLLQIGLIIFSDIVIEQRERNNERNIA